jgi:hypothetical protein
VARWKEFDALAPELAQAGRELIYQFGVGLGFLATVRADGSPRLHPFCPVIAEGGLYAFIVPSPKRSDLTRDGRYAIHAFPPEAVDDEFLVMGVAQAADGDPVREAIVAAYHTPVEPNWALFEFDIERALLARYRSRGDWPPTYSIWRADADKTSDA